MSSFGWCSDDGFCEGWIWVLIVKCELRTLSVQWPAGYCHNLRVSAAVWVVTMHTVYRAVPLYTELKYLIKWRDFETDNHEQVIMIREKSLIMYQHLDYLLIWSKIQRVIYWSDIVIISGVLLLLYLVN